jgi:hypothetical protein
MIRRDISSYLGAIEAVSRALQDQTTRNKSVKLLRVELESVPFISLNGLACIRAANTVRWPGLGVLGGPKASLPIVLTSDVRTKANRL